MLKHILSKLISGSVSTSTHLILSQDSWCTSTNVPSMTGISCLSCVMDFLSSILLNSRVHHVDRRKSCSRGYRLSSVLFSTWRMVLKLRRRRNWSNVAMIRLRSIVSVLGWRPKFAIWGITMSRVLIIINRLGSWLLYCHWCLGGCLSLLFNFNLRNFSKFGEGELLLYCLELITHLLVLL